MFSFLPDYKSTYLLIYVRKYFGAKYILREVSKTEVPITVFYLKLSSNTCMLHFSILCYNIKLLTKTFGMSRFRLYAYYLQCSRQSGISISIDQERQNKRVHLG